MPLNMEVIKIHLRSWKVFEVQLCDFESPPTPSIPPIIPIASMEGAEERQRKRVKLNHPWMQCPRLIIVDELGSPHACGMSALILLKQTMNKRPIPTTTADLTNAKRDWDNYSRCHEVASGLLSLQDFRELIKNLNYGYMADAQIHEDCLAFIYEVWGEDDDESRRYFDHCRTMTIDVDPLIPDDSLDYTQIFMDRRVKKVYHPEKELTFVDVAQVLRAYPKLMPKEWNCAHADRDAVRLLGKAETEHVPALRQVIQKGIHQKIHRIVC